MLRGLRGGPSATWGNGGRTAGTRKKVHGAVNYVAQRPRNTEVLAGVLPAGPFEGHVAAGRNPTILGWTAMMREGCQQAGIGGTGWPNDFALR